MAGSIASRLDSEALESLRAYRQAIGLEPDGFWSGVDPHFVEYCEREGLQMDDVLRVGVPPKLRELGAWVDSLSHWNVFVTATFKPVVRRYPNPRRLARMELRSRLPGADPRFGGIPASALTVGLASQSRTAGYVENFFHKFRRNLQRQVSAPITYFVGFEAGVTSGQNHFHSLLHAPRLADLQRKEIWQWLYDNAGRSLVLPFIPELGAGWYLASAYVGKRPLGWDVRVPGRSHLRWRPAPGGRGESVAPSPDLPRALFHMTLPRHHR